MSLFEVGRLCVKIAGRDAGNKCVVVESVDESFVVVDGNVRRKRVNIRHLEPLAQTITLHDRASPSDVKVAFDKLGIPVWAHKSKKVGERPHQIRTVKTYGTPKKANKAAAKPKAEKVEAKAEVKPEVKPKAVKKTVKKE